MTTLDEVMVTEQKLRDQADAGHPESWKPGAGEELTGKVARYSQAYTDRGEASIMVVESLRNPGVFRSVWLLHTTLRNEVNKQKPLPGETVYLRYQGLQKPKSGGDEYHSWKLVVDRDETRNPSFLPWEGPQDPRTEAEAMVPHSTGPATQSEQAAPWNEPEPSTDEIPF